jgi:hypothetical protein
MNINKKLIAKEILVFFTGAILLAILVVFFFIRNAYFNYKISSNVEKVNSFNQQLGELSKDNLENIYDSIKTYFVNTYKVKGAEIPIAKYQEREFIRGLLNSNENIIKSPPRKEGYYYYVREGTQPSRKARDSVIVFEHVNFEKFRTYLGNEAYLQNLYSFFSGNYIGYDWRHRRGIPTFELGTRQEFTSKVKGKLSDTKTPLLIQELLRKKKNALEEIKKAEDSFWSTKKIISFLTLSSIVLGILLFPIRWSSLLVRWALRILKSN